MNIITIKEMLAHMEEGDVFSMKVVKYDRSRKKGGQIQEYNEAKLHVKSEAEVVSEAINRPLTVVEKKMIELKQLKQKKANHYENYTKNIVLCVNKFATSELRKIHPALVLEYNNKIVVP